MHDIIVDELIEKKSIAALIYLINAGRELEFTVCEKLYFISKDKAQKSVSIWEQDVEQSFDSVEDLIENALIAGKPFLDMWKSGKIETLF